MRVAYHYGSFLAAAALTGLAVMAEWPQWITTPFAVVTLVLLVSSVLRHVLFGLDA